MKKIVFVISAIVSVVMLVIITNGCATSELIASKTGAQIWGENCIRCHNPASPGTFSDVEWDVAAMHMQIRANLTPEETKKVIEFLQSAN